MDLVSSFTHIGHLPLLYLLIEDLYSFTSILKLREGGEIDVSRYRIPSNIFSFSLVYPRRFLSQSRYCCFFVYSNIIAIFTHFYIDSYILYALVTLSLLLNIYTLLLSKQPAWRKGREFAIIGLVLSILSAYHIGLDFYMACCVRFTF
jgi:hypothetical protein